MVCWRLRECEMRLAFWRAGEEKPEVQRAAAEPAPAASPAGTTVAGDLDFGEE